MTNAPTIETGAGRTGEDGERKPASGAKFGGKIRCRTDQTVKRAESVVG